MSLHIVPPKPQRSKRAKHIAKDLLDSIHIEINRELDFLTGNYSLTKAGMNGS